MRKDDPKFRELLEKIDPAFRFARLKVEMEGGEPDGQGQGGVTIGLRQRFMDQYGQAQAQSRLVALHEKQPVPTDAEAQALRAELIKRSRENERIAWLMAEHFGDELERLNKQIEEFDKAGLPKDEAPPSENGNRAARRAKGVSL